MLGTWNPYPRSAPRPAGQPATDGRSQAVNGSDGLDARLTKIGLEYKIVLTGRPSAELATLLQTLPDCRYHSGNRIPSTQPYWTCRMTPFAAWRLHCQRGVRLCNALTVAGVIHDNALRACEAIKTADGCSPQPEVQRYPSWTHQCRAYGLSRAQDAFLLGLGMGTGKSKVAVAVVMNTGCQTTLILCPCSVRGVWRREFERHAGGPVDVLVLDGNESVKRKAEMAERFLTSCRIKSLPAVVVLNYEAAWRPEFAEFSLSRKWDCVILDESHRVGAHNTRIGKYVAKLGERAARRLCLSGTPLKQSPLDIFGQARFLDPGLFGTSWTQFSRRYAKHDNPMIPQQVTGYKNLDELQTKLGMICYRVGKEVLDLPPFQHIERPIVLGTTARRHYRNLEEEFITELESGVVTADNALVKLLRLQQATSGYLPVPDSHVTEEIGTEKADALEDILDGLDAADLPVVVFCRFVHDLASVGAVANKLGLVYREVSGARKDLTPNAEIIPDTQVLGVQIQSGGVGIDLSRACYAVYFSLGFSLAEYEQSLDRLHRPGQTRAVTYYHLVAQDTVDRRVYSALRARSDVIKAVLGGYAQ
jgi:SNF2 family DNA or RNA helicase